MREMRRRTMMWGKVVEQHVGNNGLSALCTRVILIQVFNCPSFIFLFLLACCPSSLSPSPLSYRSSRSKADFSFLLPLSSVLIFRSYSHNFA